ncbi:lipid II:glycine glycyltransferase FemX [Breznakiellaceae bacterium SP9]
MDEQPDSPLYIKELIPTDLSACNSSRSFLQSGFWGTFKARFGWIPRPFLVDWGGEAGQTPLLVIRRKLAPRVSFAYVPWGPELPADFPLDAQARTQALADLAKRLKRMLPGDTAFIRFDPPWAFCGADTAPPRILEPFQRAGADVQAPDTVHIDLLPPEEKILAAMKSKCSYNIRLAAKKGVIIEETGESGLDGFYHLLKETAKRDRIAIHGIEYYQTLFSHAKEYGTEQEVRLYTAMHEGDTLAALVALFRGKEATYLYGASSDSKRNLMAPYALQWQVMRDAKAAGCERYDLFGIPASNAPDHPMAGLYQFKTRFGGTILHRPGSWDYRYRPCVTALFSLAERLRKKFRSTKQINRRILKKEQ